MEEFMTGLIQLGKAAFRSPKKSQTVIIENVPRGSRVRKIAIGVADSMQFLLTDNGDLYCVKGLEEDVDYDGSM